MSRVYLTQCQLELTDGCLHFSTGLKDSLNCAVFCHFRALQVEKKEKEEEEGGKDKENIQGKGEEADQEKEKREEEEEKREKSGPEGDSKEEEKEKVTEEEEKAPSAPRRPKTMQIKVTLLDNTLYECELDVRAF